MKYNQFKLINILFYFLFLHTRVVFATAYPEWSEPTTIIYNEEITSIVYVDKIKQCICGNDRSPISIMLNTAPGKLTRISNDSMYNRPVFDIVCNQKTGNFVASLGKGPSTADSGIVVVGIHNMDTLPYYSLFRVSTPLSAEKVEMKGDSIDTIFAGNGNKIFQAVRFREWHYTSFREIHCSEHFFGHCADLYVTGKTGELFAGGYDNIFGDGCLIKKEGMEMVKVREGKVSSITEMKGYPGEYLALFCSTLDSGICKYDYKSNKWSDIPFVLSGNFHYPSKVAAFYVMVPTEQYFNFNKNIGDFLVVTSEKGIHYLWGYGLWEEVTTEFPYDAFSSFSRSPENWLIDFYFCSPVMSEKYTVEFEGLHVITKENYSVLPGVYFFISSVMENTIKLRFFIRDDDYYFLELIDYKGRILLSRPIRILNHYRETDLTLELPDGLSNGMYIIALLNQDKCVLQNERFIKF